MEFPIVETCYGKLKGKSVVNYNGETFYSFQGIPYAKPPLGKLRFKAPQSPDPWSGIKDATAEGNGCYAHHFIFRNEVLGSEDCLYLNVYTKTLNKKQLKPVMFWIHGGAFRDGSGGTESFGPDYLLLEDIVLVTINYRLGMLGFLSLDDPKLGVPGNAGLKDMVLALKWVQKNIQNFSGDTKNVTIFGESAGAASVHFIILSPMTKGLFHKAILQSGCALNYWVFSIKRSAKQIAEYLGFKSDEESEILDFLQKIGVEKLLRGQDSIPDRFYPMYIRDFVPTIEKLSLEEEAFLTEHPLDIIRSGRYSKVPMIIGYNNREGILFSRLESKLLQDFEYMVHHYFKLPRGSKASKELAQTIKQFYFGDKEHTKETMDLYSILRTDLFMLSDIYLTIKEHLNTSDQPIYFYRFSADTSINFTRLFTDEFKGASHADELNYLFKAEVCPDIEPFSVEEQYMKRMVNMWTHFAKYGTPNYMYQIVWKPIENDKLNFLEIGENLDTGVKPDANRLEFWDKIYNTFLPKDRYSKL